MSDGKAAASPGGSGPASSYRDPGTAASGGSVAAANLLRRRKEPRNPFGAASKAIGAVMDLGRKVRLDAITSTLQEAFSGDQRKRQPVTQAAAPVGVTQAYSVVLTHVTAPLWAVGTKPQGTTPAIAFNDPMVLNFCRGLDAKGWDIELVSEVLTQDPVLATVYIALILAKLLCLESAGEWRLNFFELAGQITRERHAREYDEQPNDELVAHDQPKRRLAEIGGAWRPRGAVDLAAPLNQLRQLCLQRVIHASVCFKYQFTDENLHTLVDALGNTLFLVSYSESVTQLMAGIKGPNYVAKYFVHLARPQSAAMDVDGYVAEPAVRSTALEAVNAAVDLAVSNLVHRNDTADVVIISLVKSLGICPPNQIRSLLKIISETMCLICCADLSILVQILDAIRPLLLEPVPIGTEARDTMSVIWTAIRNVGGPARELMANSFVAGGDMRSFRRRPAHVHVSPYASRAFLVSKMYTADVHQQRGANPMLPVSLQRNVDPLTGTNVNNMLDDTVLYLANQVANIFQATHELTAHVTDEELSKMASAPTATTRGKALAAAATAQLQRGGKSDDSGADADATADAAARGAKMAQAIGTAQLIDLPTLFSIPPVSLCGFLPHLHMLLHPRNPEVIFSDPDHTKPEIYTRIAEQYIVLADGHQPVKGQRRFRLEAPRVPFRPLVVSVASENDEAMASVKNIVDRHWKLCDQRVTDREPAYLHPKRDLSLSHFIENFIDVVVMGGTGTLRRFCETVLRLRLQYPGAVPTIRVYVVPTGYDNDFAAWLARHDPLYLHRVYAPLTCLPMASVEPQSAEALSTSPPPSLESLHLRAKLNQYLTHGTVANDIMLYQVECVNPDGTSVYIAMTSNFEIGAHVTAAVVNDGFTSSKEGLSTIPFVSHAGAGVRGFPSSPRLNRSGGGKSNASFGNRSMTSQNAAADYIPIVLEPQQITALQAVAAGFIDQHTTHLFIKLADGVREPVDRILARMHAAHRGLALSLRRHPSEAKDVPFCCVGTDLLDWISTSYHLYDTKVAASAAQTLLDRGVISCVAAAPQRPAERFTETALYVPRPREPADALPVGAAGARSATFDLAMSMKQSVEEIVANRAATNGGVPFAMRTRLMFVARDRDPQYADLAPTVNCGASTSVLGAGAAELGAIRDVACLKVKAVGATGDRGGAPLSPTSGVLQLAVYDMERKRAAAAAAASGTLSSPLRGGANAAGEREGGSGSPSGAAAGGNASGGGTGEAGSPGSPGGTAGAATGASGAADGRGAASASRPSNVGNTMELGDHYALRFGTPAKIDPKCVLSIDLVDDGVLAAVPGSNTGSHLGSTSVLNSSIIGGAATLLGAANMIGVHCCIDGDLFGPFVGFRIRPVTGAAGSGGNSSIAAGSGGLGSAGNDAPTTIPIMSFVSCSNSAAA